MGRKESAQLQLVIPGEDGPVSVDPPAKRPRSPEARRNWRQRLRLWGLAGGAIAGLVGGAVLAYRLDDFLAADRRFALSGLASGPAEPGLYIEGAVFSQRERLAEVFAGDFGRSIYLLPLARRQRSLLAVDWVRTASVSRLWPDRVVVRITERTPAAFVVLPPSGRTALIDGEGVLLSLPKRAHFNLPVLVGIAPGQPLPERRARVALALRMNEELRAWSQQISEIDVSDPENLKITQKVEEQAVRLLLGKQRFLERLRNFLNHYGEIRRRLPYAAAFDLRLDDRITALEDPADGK